MTQETVHRLLRGVGPEAFRVNSPGTDVLMVCADAVTAPAGFEKHWVSVSADEDVPERLQDEAVLAEVEVIILFAATADETQRATVLKISAALPSASPPVLIVPITICAPDATAADRLAERSRTKEGVRSLINSSCVDGVVWGMAAGHALALQVATTASQMDMQLNELHHKMLLHNERTMKAHTLRHSTHRMTWHYLRAKCFQNIPRVRDVHESDNVVSGLELGAKVSRGHFGTVRATTRPASNRAGAWRECNTLVIETMQQAYSVRDLHMISNFLSIMQTIATSGARHPRIANLLGVIHTPTRLCVCMETSGSTALFTRLRLLGARQPGVQPLSPNKIRCLVTQVADALDFLHTTAQVCHRDIKPENITIEDDEHDRVNIRLGGFELAKMRRAGSKCHSACGTLPFAAPEAIVTQKGGYDGCPADMWSFGMVCVEVACGLHVVERSLPLANLKAGPCAEISTTIISLFGKEGFVEEFMQKCTPDAAPIRAWLVEVVSKMLCVDPAERITATALHKVLASETDSREVDESTLDQQSLPDRVDSALLVE